ncbi:MAG: flagellar basal body rod protein FlgB, partial [Oscillospiraceae bacterium]|nr:flagellar basal body rod protein FlgB [Oscillospiraceae bacterium]
MGGLFNTTSFRITEQGINVMAQSNRLIAQNIANADTPGYKVKYLYFEGLLRDKIDARATEKFQKELSVGTAMYIDKKTKGRPDGNNVDNDTQQALFQKNQIRYNALVNQLNAEFELL